MPPKHAFEHLLLVRRKEGPARYPQAQFKETNATLANRRNRPKHERKLRSQSSAVSAAWQSQQEQRKEEGLPKLDSGVPLLLQIDPSLDIDDLRNFFGFEIVSEQADGFVIVASADLSLARLQQKLTDFVGEVRGSSSVAKIQELREDLTQEERLRRILSERLFSELPLLDTDEEYIVDVSFSCTGDWTVPRKPKRGRMKKDTWTKKLQEWSEARAAAYDKWDDLREERVATVEGFVKFYGGKILLNIDGEDVDVPSLPDSFVLRLRLPGRGVKDLLLNDAYVFEAVEPEDVELPQRHARELRRIKAEVVVLPPREDAPTVCIIDSGIQEEHIYLAPAIDSESSHCFVPGTSGTDAGDYVRNGGHGTRVAGAVLYGDNIRSAGRYRSRIWIQNARVLDANCRLSEDLLPAALVREVVQRYHTGPRGTRIFNHSINSSAPCRTTHMSAWAAEIDRLCYEYDILFIQSAGNLSAARSGVAAHLAAGRTYPGYLGEKTCRIANPAQSLQAITVGSVCYKAFTESDWRSFGRRSGEPSAFSRSGLGMWGSIKPDVVEFGGDYLLTPGSPPSIAIPSHARSCYPRLVRSTRYGGPAFERDDVGTSYSAPKVARIAAALQAAFPNESCLLYRALIIQSARWPAWANDLSGDEMTALISRIGYGVPDRKRATINTDYRATYVTQGEQQISPGGCHVYQVPIHSKLRRVGREYNYRIEVTLSYAAEPRRTRRLHRGYLSTWLDWISNWRDEDVDDFLTRAIKDKDTPQSDGQNIKWAISSRATDGEIADVRRSIGTVQKDWADIKSHQLPRNLCIAVRGHKGWSSDPETAASYTLAVTIEAVGEEIKIYEPLRASVEELQAELAPVEAEVEVEE